MAEIIFTDLNTCHQVSNLEALATVYNPVLVNYGRTSDTGLLCYTQPAATSLKNSVSPNCVVSKTATVREGEYTIPTVCTTFL